MIKLRKYQLEALEAIKKEYESGLLKQLVVMPTGTGKSLVFVNIKDFLGLRKKILFLVHRDELIQQAKKHFEKWCPKEVVEIEQADAYSTSAATTILASVQTLGRKNSTRINRFNPNDFDLIIIDEVHHSTASSYLRVLNYFSSNKSILLVGFTATPNRSDAIGLNNVLDKIVYNYPIYHETEPSAIKDGYLVDIKGIRVQSDVGLDHIPTIAGDLAQNELEKTINVSNRNELIVKAWTTYGENRPTIAFCSGVAHSQALAKTFTNYNIKAEAVWGEDTQRKVKLEHFRNGKITVLTNCQLLGEGVDLPITSSVIMARPTKSSLVYSQQLGRALRLPEGLHHISEAISRGLKKDAILIDIVDNTKRHSIITVPSILGLPLGLDLEGKSLLEAAEKIKELKAQNPETNYDKLYKLSEIDLYTEEVDLFDTTLAVEVADFTQLNWRKIDENEYSIKYKQGEAAIEAEDAATGRLWRIKAGFKVSLLDDTASSLRSAFIYADSWLKVHLDYFTYSLLKNDSKISKTLKKQKITERQLEFLSKFRPHFKEKFSKLSKFEASRLIDKILK